MTPKKKRPQTALEKMSDKKLMKEIRRDLHTMVLEAEARLAQKPKKHKG